MKLHVGYVVLDIWNCLNYRLPLPRIFCFGINSASSSLGTAIPLVCSFVYYWLSLYSWFVSIIYTLWLFAFHVAHKDNNSVNGTFSVLVSYCCYWNDILCHCGVAFCSWYYQNTGLTLGLLFPSTLYWSAFSYVIFKHSYDLWHDLLDLGF